MKYHKFIINHYRAIEGPMVIDLAKNSLIPIIGVNECGKTTILNAIFSFDYHNDKLNNNGRHLQDVTNLYSLSPEMPKISAEVEISTDEFTDMLDSVEEEHPLKYTSAIRSYKRLRNRISRTLTITRDLKSNLYNIDNPLLCNIELNASIAMQIIRHLPYLLYFDDFRDSVENRVEIIKEQSDSGWLAIFETLFQKTDNAFSVFDLPEKEERQRKAILAKVNRKLNASLTHEWQNFRLDDADALRIEINYEEEPAQGGNKRPFLKLDVIERDMLGDQHYFFVRDRSKGFFWFFNFVMKLEYNPKVIENTDVDAIYLLDEPGSYLHAAAQAKLAIKLRNLSDRNKVVYCTHSHHLLDPEVIPINTIRIAEKDGQGNVRLIPLHEHHGSLIERRSAYQPLIDALQLRPLALDFGHAPTIIVEGIIDYFLLDIFKANRGLTILPSVGAESIKYYISLMIAWRMIYCVLWDNDPAGRASREDATSHFGNVEAQLHFFLLPLKGKSKNRIMQNMIEGSDLVFLRESLNLTKNASFEKTIAAWYYVPNRNELLQQLSSITHQNFKNLFDELPLA